jgi:hypothetical protein
MSPVAIPLPVVISITAIVVGAVIAVAIQVIRQRREDRFRREDAAAREHAARAQAAAERDRRVAAVVAAYVPNVVRVGNEQGALEAGVLTLHDSSEVRDFCDRVAIQTPRDKAIPDVRRSRIPDDELLEYFNRLARIDNWTTTPDLVDQLIEELRRAG